ncbi:VWA domain-containing protein [Rhizobium sp. AAP43]|uniref:VWA domain-containing protein n=1 Tax=Rhizobium sp. AAP43 TaxID=1523420 RepID=UPI0006B8D8A6|nr:VWA domain-containing protein [Rhizobium sp. AAP43]KPF43444.1 hypothetical protein IP76_13895 [Rhizobium sp. AAP43]
MVERAPHEAFEQALRDHGREQWDDALLVADLLRLGGAATGGIWLRARASGVRDVYLAHLRQCAPPDLAWLRLPAGTTAHHLSAAIDIAATAESGRRVERAGLIEASRGGVLVLPMAERMDRTVTAMITAANDDDKEQPTVLVALDESVDDDEGLPVALGDRLGLRLNLHAVAWHQTQNIVTDQPPAFDRRWHQVSIDDGRLSFLATMALTSGHKSIRILHHLARIARMLAHLNARTGVEDQDAITALRLCLGLRLSPPSTECMVVEEEKTPGTHPGQSSANRADDPPLSPHDDSQPGTDTLKDMLAAVQAATISGDLLVDASTRPRNQARRSGKSGHAMKHARRGRPIGTSLSAPQPDARPDVIATLRAAAPWQKLRLAQSHAGQVEAALVENDGSQPPSWKPKAFIIRDDFRYLRLRHATPSAAIFIVDASGSTALDRLGEAKGAIEHLLSRCYARRDEVALIAFRGTTAETLLPPTRSLVAAKRKLGALPGGGATPLASGLQRGLELALSLRRRGTTPVIVLLTDGSGNIALDGTADRAKAADDLVKMTRAYRVESIKTVCIDVARRPRESVAVLARDLNADLHRLRQADAERISTLVDTSLREARP